MNAKKKRISKNFKTELGLCFSGNNAPRATRAMLLRIVVIGRVGQSENTITPVFR